MSTNDRINPRIDENAEPVCPGWGRGEDKECPSLSGHLGDHGEVEIVRCMVDNSICTRGGPCGPALRQQRDEARATTARWMEEAERWRRRCARAVGECSMLCPASDARCNEITCQECWGAATEADFAQFDEEEAGDDN